MLRIADELKNGDYSIVVSVVRQSKDQVNLIFSRPCPSHFIYAILARSIPLSYEISDPEPIIVKCVSDRVWVLSGDTEFYAERLGYTLHYWKNGVYEFSASSLREYCIESSAWKHEQWIKELNGQAPDYYGESFPNSPPALTIEFEQKNVMNYPIRM
jgi:hypothetical protein